MDDLILLLILWLPGDGASGVVTGKPFLRKSAESVIHRQSLEFHARMAAAAAARGLYHRNREVAPVECGFRMEPNAAGESALQPRYRANDIAHVGFLNVVRMRYWGWVWRNENLQ